MVQIEKLVNHCDMELMKIAMLRHEETFRQQVRHTHTHSTQPRRSKSGLIHSDECVVIICCPFLLCAYRSTSCTACTASRSSS